MNALKIYRKQASKKYSKINELAHHARSIKNWIEYTRKALGYTPKQLAQKMEIAVSTLHQIERNEKQDKLTIASLKKAAEAMGCEFVYAIVPIGELDQIVKTQSMKRARQIVLNTDLHMSLEDQSVSKQDLQNQIEELAEEMALSKNLWDEDVS